MPRVGAPCGKASGMSKHALEQKAKHQMWQSRLSSKTSPSSQVYPFCSVPCVLDAGQEAHLEQACAGKGQVEMRDSNAPQFSFKMFFGAP
eukprot:3420038-Amphidinium_carterae.1